MQVHNFRELPFSARLGLFWSWTWRAIIMFFGLTVASLVVSGVAGALLGLVASRLGYGVETIKSWAALVGGLIGIACGLLSTWFYIRWLLTARLGRWRLLLVRDEDAPAEIRMDAG